MNEAIQADIEARLAHAEPDVEVLLAERVGTDTIRLVIDRPGGVDLGTCERVTGHLRELLAEAALEVSSPGPERPLTRPAHFRRFVGRRVRVRMSAPRAGRRTFTGELVAASDDGVTLAADDGVVAIAYAEMRRSNLVPDADASARSQPDLTADRRGG